MSVREHHGGIDGWAVSDGIPKTGSLCYVYPEDEKCCVPIVHNTPVINGLLIEQWEWFEFCRDHCPICNHDASHDDLPLPNRFVTRHDHD